MKGTNGATMENPPRQLYRIWTAVGPVTNTSKTSNTQTPFQQMTEMISKMAEMQGNMMSFNMMSQMGDMMKQFPAMQSGLSNIRPQLAIEPLRAPVENEAPTAPTASVASTASSAPNQLRSSSPPGPPNEDEWQLEDFWNWKFRRINNAQGRTKLAAAKIIINEEMWTVEDMRRMSDEKSAIYQEAKAKGLLLGLITRFKADIHEFKPTYRSHYRPERRSLAIRNAAIGQEEPRGF